MLYDEEYIARVTCVENGASEEYSKEMVVNVYIERDNTCNESFADLTTATTASTNIVSISSTPSHNAFQQNLVNCDDTLGLWPVYVALSFLIGVATGCIVYCFAAKQMQRKTTDQVGVVLFMCHKQLQIRTCLKHKL